MESTSKKVAKLDFTTLNVEVKGYYCLFINTVHLEFVSEKKIAFLLSNQSFSNHFLFVNVFAMSSCEVSLISQ